MLVMIPGTGEAEAGGSQKGEGRRVSYKIGTVVPAYYPSINKTEATKTRF